MDVMIELNRRDSLIKNDLTPLDQDDVVVT